MHLQYNTQMGHLKGKICIITYKAQAKSCYASCNSKNYMATLRNDRLTVMQLHIDALYSNGTSEEKGLYRYLQTQATSCYDSCSSNYMATSAMTGLQILKLYGSTKKTLWQLCHLVVIETPGECGDQAVV